MPLSKSYETLRILELLIVMFYSIALSPTSLTSQTMLLQELSVWLDEFGIFICDYGVKVEYPMCHGQEI